MQNGPGIFGAGRIIRQDFPQWLLKPFSALLKTGEPASSIDRLFVSRHVKDLRLIAAAASISILLILAIGLILSIWIATEQSPTDQQSTVLHRWLIEVQGFGQFFVPVLAVFGAILTWVYQVGAARLGVVDLFACEIATLCRVAAAVDTVRNYVQRFEGGPPVEHEGHGNPHLPASRFTSEESYFPVFEGATRDLESLEANVVINITAFYTYMKTVRDYMRALADTMPGGVGLTSASRQAGPWYETLRNIIYMLFLAMESARHAIVDLVEFEPHRAERTVLILLSELEAYGFLCTQFTEEGDVRRSRIVMRESEYRDLAPTLYFYVEDKHKAEAEAATTNFRSEWEPAWRLLPELKRRYELALGPIKS
jgi:hypothetical protein